jgi:hypothetical protein
VEVQVQLTSAWWKKTKRPFKGVPNTGLGKKFTAWETALAAVQKDKTAPKLDAANKALKRRPLLLPQLLESQPKANKELIATIKKIRAAAE